MAKVYAVVMGALLLLFGIFGFLRTDFFDLHFSPAHNWIHLLSGVFGLWAGLDKKGYGAKMYAQMLGVFYTVVAIAGFAAVPEFLMNMLDLNTSYNVIHIVVGLLGVLSGFAIERTGPT
jgi:hypothetical protein